MIYYKAWGTGHVVIFLLPHSALCVREYPRRYEKRLTRCQTPAAPPVRDAPPPASHVTVTAASVVPLALAPANASHVAVAVTAASAVPRVTVASPAAPAAAVQAAASEGKQTHKYHRRLQQTG